MHLYMDFLIVDVDNLVHQGYGLGNKDIAEFLHAVGILHVILVIGNCLEAEPQR